MNSKLEHYAPALGRMVLERGVVGRGQEAMRIVGARRKIKKVHPT